MSALDLKRYIRDIPDFPTPGILFRDITPLIRDPAAFDYTVDALLSAYRDRRIDAVVGVEARGFIFGAPLALRMECAFIPVRKAGKLPFRTRTASYTLEYGEAAVQVHVDAIDAGQQVLIVDDLLATGGTLEATASLVAASGAEVAGIAVVIELADLGGRARLAGYELTSLLTY